MDRMRRILSGFNAILAIGLAVTLTVCVVRVKSLADLGDLGDYILGPNPSSITQRVLVSLVAVTILIPNAIYVAARMFRSPWDTYLRARTPHGEVLVSIDAVEEVLERYGATIPEVQHLRVRVRKDRRDATSPAQIEISCAVWEAARFREVAQKMETLLKARFDELIDLAPPPAFRITLDRMVQRSEPKPPTPPKKDKKDPEVPAFLEAFRSQYPVDTE